MSTFIVLLDSSVAFIALPAISADLGSTLVEATWVIAAVILGFAVLLLVCSASSATTKGEHDDRGSLG